MSKELTKEEKLELEKAKKAAQEDMKEEYASSKIRNRNTKSRNTAK